MANVASRLSVQAAAGQTLIGQRLFAAVEEAVETASAGNLELGLRPPRHCLRRPRAALDRLEQELRTSVPTWKAGDTIPGGSLCAGACRRGELSGRRSLRSRDAGSRVGVVLVQRLMLEQCTRARRAAPDSPSGG